MKENLRVIPYEYTCMYGDVSYSFKINLVEAYGKRRFASEVNADIGQWAFGKSGLKLEEARDEYVEEESDRFRAACDRELLLASQEGVRPHTRDCELVIDMKPAAQCASGVIGIDIEVCRSTGGAKDERLVTCRNYSCKDGHLISLDEIFEDGYQERLEQLLETGLLEYTGCENPGQLGDAGYYPDADVFIPDNFRIESEGIVFIYNQYDIAPYSTGVTELSVSRRDMRRAGIRHSGITWK